MGERDIAERLQQCIEQQIRMVPPAPPISTLNRPGEELAKALQKAINEFLDKLPQQQGEAFEFSIPGNSPSSSPTKVSISNNAIRARVFNPVLQSIFDEIRSGIEGLTKISGQREFLVLITGPLGTCPYLKTFMKRKLNGMAKILETQEEITCCSKGGALWHNEPQNLPHLHSAGNTPFIIEQDSFRSRLEELRDWENELERSHRDIRFLLREYEMILWEKIQRLSLHDESVKKTIVAIRDIYLRHNSGTISLRPLDSRKTPEGLNIAAALGAQSAVERILSSYVYQIIQNKFHLDQALYYAALSGQQATVSFLLQNGADINLCTFATPLEAASMSDNVRLVHYLLDNGARFDDSLHAAAEAGSEDTLRALLMKGAVIDAPGRTSYPSPSHHTPLCTAALLGRPKIVRLLLDYGADINKFFDDSYFFTPIRTAARMKHSGAVKLLLEHGADPCAGGSYSALHDAAFFGSFEVAKVLVAHGVNNFAQEVYNATPLDSALFSCGHRDGLRLVRLLMENGSAIVWHPVIHQLPLHWWAELTCAVADEQNLTAIFHALLQGRKELVNELDSNGQSPLHRTVQAMYACRYQPVHDPMPHIRILASQGAVDMKLRDQGGNTALDLADKAATSVAEELYDYERHPEKWSQHETIFFHAKAKVIEKVQGYLRSGI